MELKQILIVILFNLGIFVPSWYMYSKESRRHKEIKKAFANWDLNDPES